LSDLFHHRIPLLREKTVPSGLSVVKPRLLGINIRGYSMLFEFTADTIELVRQVSVDVAKLVK
jgi:hypothetical protein